MAKTVHAALSRRERQIMDILYRRGRATAGEVMDELTGTPSYSTVRTQLRVLEAKGHVRHEEEGLRYVYIPALPRHAGNHVIGNVRLGRIQIHVLGLGQHDAQSLGRGRFPSHRLDLFAEADDVVLTELLELLRGLRSLAGQLRAQFGV